MFRMEEIKIDRNNQSIPKPGKLISRRLLGELEAEIMQYMWDIEQATVHHIVEKINSQRPIAYTTVMTVMGHLVDKGLLTRTTEGKRYVYYVAQSQNEFLLRTSQTVVRRVLNDFGDLAIAGFLGEIGKVKPEKLEDLKNLLQEAMDETNTSE